MLYTRVIGAEVILEISSAVMSRFESNARYASDSYVVSPASRRDSVSRAMDVIVNR